MRVKQIDKNHVCMESERGVPRVVLEVFWTIFGAGKQE